MAPPSKLAIASSAVQRLVKEEASYHKELEQQQGRIHKLESGSGDENAVYQLKQEKQALAETKTVLASMKGKIDAAVEELDNQLEENQDDGGGASTEDITRAKEIIAAAKKAIRGNA